MYKFSDIVLIKKPAEFILQVSLFKTNL